MEFDSISVRDLISRTGIDVRRASASARLAESGRCSCRTTTKAIPGRDGIALSKPCSCSSHPVETPIPTINGLVSARLECFLPDWAIAAEGGVAALGGRSGKAPLVRTSARDRRC